MWRRWKSQYEDGLLFPVAAREMRSLMRGNRAPVALFLCTGIAITFGLFLFQWKLNVSALSVEEMAAVGRSLFAGIVLLETGLAVLLVPMLTGGLLTREYGQKSLDDLRLTRLTGMEIVLGKLLAGIGFAAVVMICMLPVLAMVFAFGGVSPVELIGSQLLVLALAAYFGAAAICYAAHYRHLIAILLLTWVLTPVTMLLGLPFQFSIVLTITLLTRGQEWITAHEGSWWKRRLPVILYGFFVMLPIMLLIPLLIFVCFVGFSPPVVMALLLRPDSFGLSDFLGVLRAVWWLLPIFSTLMLAYGAQAMLDDAAAEIRLREGEI